MRRIQNAGHTCCRLTLLAAGFLISTISVVHASIVAPLTIEEMAAVADEIVQASITTSESDWYGGKIVTRHEIEVIDSAKGAQAKGASMTLYTLGGKVGPIGAVAPGVPELTPGEEVVLFLEYPDHAKAKAAGTKVDEKSPLNTTPLIIGGFQGKFTVVAATEQHEVPGGKTLEVDKRKVFRGTPGLAPTLGNMPTVGDFMASLKRLNDKSLPHKTVLREVGSKSGVAVKVPNPNDRALRVFDPFPKADDNASQKLKLIKKPDTGPAGTPRRASIGSQGNEQANQ